MVINTVKQELREKLILISSGKGNLWKIKRKTQGLMQSNKILKSEVPIK